MASSLWAWAWLTLVALASLVNGAPHTRTQTAPAPASGWGFTDPKGFALLSAIQLIDSACRTGFLTFFPFLLIAKGASVASIGFGSRSSSSAAPRASSYAG